MVIEDVSIEDKLLLHLFLNAEAYYVQKRIFLLYYVNSYLCKLVYVLALLIYFK